jgi:hypothetical protein
MAKTTWRAEVHSHCIRFSGRPHQPHVAAALRAANRPSPEGRRPVATPFVRDALRHSKVRRRIRPTSPKVLAREITNGAFVPLERIELDRSIRYTIRPFIIPAPAIFPLWEAPLTPISRPSEAIVAAKMPARLQTIVLNSQVEAAPRNSRSAQTRAVVLRKSPRYFFQLFPRPKRNNQPLRHRTFHDRPLDVSRGPTRSSPHDTLAFFPFKSCFTNREKRESMEKTEISTADLHA